MKMEFTIDRFEGEKAILKNEDGEVVSWPRNKLPENSHEGSLLLFNVAGDGEKESEKREAAKDILNELLNIEDEA